MYNHGTEEEREFQQDLVPNQFIGHKIFYAFIEFLGLDLLYILFSFANYGLDLNLRKAVTNSTEKVLTTPEQRFSFYLLVS